MNDASVIRVQSRLAFCCRITLSETSGWAHLPIHLLILPMQKVWKIDRPGSYQKLQLVCKSWRKGYFESSRDIVQAHVCIQGSFALFEVCKAVPNLSSLTISSYKAIDSLHLHPLAACSRLTSISFLYGDSTQRVPVLDLLHMLSELRHLGIEAFEIAVEGNEYFKCTQLTSLTFLPRTSPESACLEFLQRLPDLKVWLTIHAAVAIFCCRKQGISSKLILMTLFCHRSCTWGEKLP